MSAGPIVSVEQGQLQGRNSITPTGKPFYSFQGIPYAKPPLGFLRFRAPQPAESWDGVRAATSEGNVTVQMDLFGKGFTGDENCLFLNVYTPNLDGADLPVMFFIHGGGFSFGSGNTDLYGPDYLVEKDVVLVTINYRCGVFGFLGLNTPEVPGNAGMKDIVQALKWVKANIHNFGGNADNITIFGESAGGAAVSYLVVCPLTKNMISKAIIQSGTAFGSFAFQNSPVENAKEFAKNLGCNSENIGEILEFLRARSPKELIDAQQAMTSPEKFLERLNVFSVVVEKEFSVVEAIITESFNDLLTSGRIADIPIMIGACSLEYSFDITLEDLQVFVPKELNIKKGSPESVEIVKKLKQLYINDDTDGLYELISDRIIKTDTNRVVRYLVQVTNKPVYYYKFDYFGALNIYNKILHQNSRRAGHMDELGHLFRNDFQNDVKLSDRDSKVRERMVRLWTNFAKYGNPTPAKSEYLTVTWPAATTDSLHYLNIGSELTVGSDPDKEKMDYWNYLYNKYYRIWEHPNTNTDEVPVKYEPPVVVNGIPAKASAAVTKVNNVDEKPAPATTQMQSTILSQTVVSANDPPEDDLPKNIGVNKFVNFYDSLGGNK